MWLYDRWQVPIEGSTTQPVRTNGLLDSEKYLIKIACLDFLPLKRKESNAALHFVKSKRKACTKGPFLCFSHQRNFSRKTCCEID